MHTEKLSQCSFIILHFVGLKCLSDQSVLTIKREKTQIFLCEKGFVLLSCQMPKEKWRK